MQGIAGGVAALFVGACVAVLWGARRSPRGDRADVAIILGAAVRGDRPSAAFARRIEHGVALYEAGLAPILIFTGGVGAGSRLAESEVARDYARSLGVPLDAMRCETRSTSTWTNLVEALAVMGTLRAQTALLVSDALHLQRATAMAAALDLDASPSACARPSPHRWIPWGRFWLREATALLYFWMWNRPWSRAASHTSGARRRR